MRRLPFSLRLTLTLAALMAGLSALAVAAGTLRPRSELAFVDLAGLQLIDLNTGLTHHPVRAFGTYGAPVWSPDGSRLAFESNFSGSGTEIYVMNADGSGLRALTDNQTDSREPVWSPDGRRMAYTYDVSFDDGDNEIFVIDLGTGFSRNLTHHPATDYSPVWSPDGRQIVFLSDRDRLNTNTFVQDIYVMDADTGGSVKRLTNASAGTTVYDLAWSPDGGKVAFAQIDRVSQMSFLQVMDSQTGQIAFSDSIRALGAQGAWSPDGRWLAYTWGRSIYLARADGQDRPTMLTRAGNLFPVWSPDGRQIAFVSQKASELGLFVIRVDGSGLRRLTSIGTAFPNWRP